MNRTIWKCTGTIQTAAAVQLNVVKYVSTTVPVFNRVSIARKFGFEEATLVSEQMNMVAQAELTRTTTEIQTLRALLSGTVQAVTSLGPVEVFVLPNEFELYQTRLTTLETELARMIVL